jgi:flagellar motor switch protein FliG
MAQTQPDPNATPPVARPAPPAPKLAGAKKVAALLLSMDKRLASRLLKHFDEDDIKLIAQTASDLGTVSKPVLEELIEEFATNLKSGGDLLATADEVEQLLNGVVPPEQINEIMSQVRSKSLQSIWLRLGEVPENSLSQYLTKEHPQIAALVLSRASPAYAAGTLRLLPGLMRNEVMRRMLSIKPILEAPLKLLELNLKEDILYKSARNSGPTIHARLADIINKMDRKHMDEVLQDLEAHRPKEAEIVRSLLFTFEDIAKLNTTALLALFDQVPPERTIIALNGSEAYLRDKILEAVPARARRMIEQEVSTGKKPLTKEITKARRAIADLALELIEKGVIELNAQDEEEE